MKFNARMILVGLAMSWCGSASAAVDAQQAAELGKTLTPVGAEVAGNKEGTIPAYTGGNTTLPAGYKKGDFKLVDPFSSDKPLYSIDAKNMAQYADKLTDGAKALMKRYPTFRIDVYPSHRSVAFPKYVLDNTESCATTSTVSNQGRTVKGCLAGYPFPIPKDGFEAMWNHLLRFSGRADHIKYRSYNVNGGHATLSVDANAYEDYPYWDSAKAGTDIFYRLKLIYTGPARRAGEQVMVMDPLDYAEKGRRAWQYLPGQRRVKLAPDIEFDTPNPGTAGATTWDDGFVFNGSMERYNFKLIGKKEMYVPYNDYKAIFFAKQDQLLTPNTLDPDLVRWELHRVWVVEADLLPGKRHIYSKRTFYLDEDSWAALASDEYDAQGQLYRAAFGLETPRYDVPSPYSDCTVQYDFISGIYAMTAWTGEDGGIRETKPLPDLEWTPDAMAGSGIR